MATDGDSAEVTAVFEKIGDLEKEFASVELDARMHGPSGHGKR